jgi:cytidylate kinase
MSALITLSASFGAGGSHVGPELARRLDAAFVDRAIPTAVADRLAVPLAQALDRDQSVGGVLERMLSRFAPVAQLTSGAPVPLDAVPIDDRSYVEATEAVIRELAAGGAAVILGRAAALVLREDPRALHVRLDGPAEGRIAQAMRLEGLDRETAERRLAETDRARETYVQHFYRADPRDAALYHLVLDSTAIDLGACADIVERAVRARAG